MELLARHNHEVWAQGRIREQWKWGPHRDDLAKTHPTLVPYECLSESEKEYDRESARESLKAIRYFGYVIHRADPSVASDDGPVATSPEQLRAAVAALRDQDEPLLAYDALVKGLARWPSDVRLRQLHALDRLPGVETQGLRRVPDVPAGGLAAGVAPPAGAPRDVFTLLRGTFSATGAPALQLPSAPGGNHAETRSDRGRIDGRAHPVRLRFVPEPRMG